MWESQCQSCSQTCLPLSTILTWMWVWECESQSESYSRTCIPASIILWSGMRKGRRASGVVCSWRLFSRGGGGGKVRACIAGIAFFFLNQILESIEISRNLDKFSFSHFWRLNLQYTFLLTGRNAHRGRGKKRRPSDRESRVTICR